MLGADGATQEFGPCDGADGQLLIHSDPRPELAVLWGIGDQSTNKVARIKMNQPLLPGSREEVALRSA